MSSSKLIIPLTLSILILLQTTISANPLFSFCSSPSGNFSDYSPYQTNLNKLLTVLYVKSPATGFALHRVNGDYSKVNGFALCRGDVNSSDCQSCIAEANNDIRVLCSNGKQAGVWYDDCLLKYSDKDFFGIVDKVNEFELLNVNNVKGVDADVFNRETRELLTGLAAQASDNATSFFARGETEVYGTPSLKVYGMAQCTRDLSKEDCKACLVDAIDVLPSCCGGKQGARVVGGSCTVQYEIYPFLKS